jgi:hypothetical protein
MFLGGPPGGAGGAAAGGGAGGAAGFTAAGLDIIIVPLNFEAAAFGLSAVPQATHWVAVSVFGFPQFGQKTVTCVPPAKSVPRVLPSKGAPGRGSDLACSTPTRAATTDDLATRGC